MTYKCAMCKGEFEEGWSDEEAKAEKEELWGDIPMDQCDVVCDDCFQKINPTNHPDEYNKCLKEAGIEP